jgi:hypothetical protein
MALRVTKQGLEAIGVKDEWWPLPRKQAFVRLLPLRSKRLQPRTLRTGTAGGSVGATAWSGAGAAVTLRTSRTQKGRTTRRAECSASGLVAALGTTPDFNARCRKGRDIAGAVTSDTDPALSHVHRNAPRHATASAGCRGSSAQARSGRHRRYRQRLRPAQTG